MSENPPPADSNPTGLTSTISYAGPAPNKDEINLTLLMYILTIFTGFIAPLIIWLIKKDQSQFINDQGKEVLNWCITFILAYIVCVLLMFVVIGIFLIPVLLILHVVFTIMGAVKASKGIAYRY
ncbi:MAG: DUF4870 domain-containing protein, partial [Phycisphaerae bacterium]|nr:DUF4870 domain-containing protein [Phycisphaerae bacterium]